VWFPMENVISDQHPMDTMKGAVKDITKCIVEIINLYLIPEQTSDLLLQHHATMKSSQQKTVEFSSNLMCSNKF